MEKLIKNMVELSGCQNKEDVTKEVERLVNSKIWKPTKGIDHLMPVVKLIHREGGDLSVIYAGVYQIAESQHKSKEQKERCRITAKQFLGKLTFKDAGMLKVEKKKKQ